MIRFPLALAAAALLLFAPMAAAAAETGDAGDLLPGAQDLTPGGVTQIDGNFANSSDVDLYRLCLPGGGSFSASTVGGSVVDTQLFLFDSSGRGVYGNDDEGSSRQSTLPAGDPLTPAAAGEYYLAVAPYNRDPNSDAGPIFASLGPVLAPTGIGGGQPVSGWSGRVSGRGPYRVVLTGASCVVPDSTPPTIDLRTPFDGAEYLLGEDVAADYRCTDEPGGSGLVSCVGTVADGAAVDTSSVGGRTFEVDAADAAANTAAARNVYRVVYDFGGFLWPVRNPPAINHWRAGLPVPIRFALDGDRGRDVIEEGWPRVAQIECGSRAEPASAEPARHPRWFRELAFRKRTARYVFLWRTRREWAGTCRRFLLRLNDGTVKRADFEFVRH
ncbi:MAG TPA: DVUA0089 family protein [Thermoleophilaceae bacterium]|nr:DVUA0089 family protein [Thermoleophilaceae bacterium]